MEAVLVLLLLGGTVCTVNALSILHDAARAGRTIETWKPWATEYTSLAGFIIALPIVFLVLRRARAGRGFVHNAAIILLGSLAFSALHLATMVLLRKLLWWTAGQSYGFDVLGDWLYEYRKDAIGYATALLVLSFAPLLPRWPAARPVRGGEALPPLVRLTDGRRDVQLDPLMLRAVRGGGNYVELIFADQSRSLIRTTLEAVERTLAPHGFRRTHKSWLVQLASIRRLDRTEAGDFHLGLDEGLEVPLSRRHRAALAEVRNRLAPELHFE